MTGHLRRLKFLSWVFIQVGTLATCSIVVLKFLVEFLMLGAISFFFPVNEALEAKDLMSEPGFGIILVVEYALLPAKGVGIGVLGVVLLEKLYRQVRINAAVLWALVVCLVICLVVNELLPSIKSLLRGSEVTILSGSLIETIQIQGLCTIVGVFWKGRRYWR